MSVTSMFGRKTKLVLQPSDDRILVEPVKANEKTDGGLFIPDAAQEKPQIGTVRAVGPGKITDQGVRIPMEYSVGQKILFGKYSGTEVEVAGQSYLLIKSADVLAVVVE